MEEDSSQIERGAMPYSDVKKNFLNYSSHPCGSVPYKWASR